jgi:TIR domain
MVTSGQLDFDLVVAQHPWGGRTARVLDSPVGGTRPVPIADLPVDRFLLASVGTPLDEADARELGIRLFDAVVRDEVRSAFTASRELAERYRTALRVRLRLPSTGDLAELPWEYLYDGVDQGFLALSPSTPVVRYVPAPSPLPPVPLVSPLRVLALTTSPGARPSVDGEVQWQWLEGILAVLQWSGAVRLERASIDAPDGVRPRLGAEPYHVVHVADGGWDGAALGTLLRDHPTVRLVVLDVGRRRDRPPHWSRVARALTERGIPGVVAIGPGMTADGAAALFRSLYSVVAEGAPLDAAVTEARLAVRRETGLAEWGAAGLYLSAPDGRLFGASSEWPSAVPRRSPTRGWETGGTAEQSPAEPPLADPSPLVDEDVRFSVYRPRVMTAGSWSSLLVLAHKSQSYDDPLRGPVDPLDRVRKLVRERYGDTPVDQTSNDAGQGILRGSALRVEVDLPGFECNPPVAEFQWLEDVHEAHFRLRPRADLAGTTVRGFVRVWHDLLIVSESSLSILVSRAGVSARSSGGSEPDPVEPMNVYRRIFPSYARHDREVLEHFTTLVHALGDRYLQDVVVLRSGERWNERLLDLIAEADVFQLFWSRNSMRSPFCRLEWEWALALGRPSFIRPVYWQEPLPADPALGLPPVGLRDLHFAYVAMDPQATTGRLPASPPSGPIRGDDVTRERPSSPVPRAPARPVPPLDGVEAPSVPPRIPEPPSTPQGPGRAEIPWSWQPEPPSATSDRPSKGRLITAVLAAVAVLVLVVTVTVFLYLRAR